MASENEITELHILRTSYVRIFCFIYILNVYVTAATCDICYSLTYGMEFVDFTMKIANDKHQAKKELYYGEIKPLRALLQVYMEMNNDSVFQLYAKLISFYLCAYVFPVIFSFLSFYIIIQFYCYLHMYASVQYKISQISTIYIMHHATLLLLPLKSLFIIDNLSYNLLSKTF